MGPTGGGVGVGEGLGTIGVGDGEGLLAIGVGEGLEAGGLELVGLGLGGITVPLVGWPQDKPTSQTQVTAPVGCQPAVVPVLRQLR